MQIRERVRRARRDLQRIQAMAGKGALVAELVAVEQRLQPLAESLADALGKWNLLREGSFFSESSVSEIEEQRAQVSSRVSRFKVRLEESPPNPTGGKDLKNLTDSMARLRKSVNEVSGEVWRKHLEASLGPAESVIPLATPGQKDLVEEVKELADRVRREWSIPPRDAETLDRFRALLVKLDGTLKRISTLEIPANVKDFLDRAERSQGAQFLMITPEIFQWLLGHTDIRSDLVVKRR